MALSPGQTTNLNQAKAALTLALEATKNADVEKAEDHLATALGEIQAVIDEG
jgi:hypothetical protein